MNNTAEKTTAHSKQSAELATLHVLGGLSLHDRAGQPIELTARKSRQLLAFLAVPSEQTRSREHLAALLWSDRQEEQARSSLRTALSGIRRALGDDALIIEQDGVRLRPGQLATDYDQLKRLASDAGEISNLQDFYGGEFLAGNEYDGELFTDWLRGLRSECVDLALVVLEKNADRMAQEGNTRAAIDLMRESLSLEPLKEETHRAIMKLYAANGEKAMALAQFRTCKEVLLHELDAGPDPATQTLADSIALRDASVPINLHRQVELIPVAATMPASSKQSPGMGEASVAILPFVNMSGDAEQNYFADGMTEDIITDLSRVNALSIAAKSASQMYRGATVAPAQISAELGVRYILEGSVRKAGDKVRISAHLTDAKTGLQKWSQRYDRQLENIFDLQAEISKSIVRALKPNLLSDNASTIEKRTTANVEAYQYFMRGQDALQNRAKRRVQLAYDLFKQAVSIDPEYALAYTGIASSVATLFLHYDFGPDMLAEAKEHCDTALRLQPGLAEAYSARGSIFILEKNFDLAKKDLLKSLEISPDLAEAHFYMGQYHLTIDEGVEQAYYSQKRAFDLSSHLTHGMMLSTCLRGLEKWDELREVSEKILGISQRKFSLDPHDATAAYMIAHALNDLGQPEKARHWASVAGAFDTEDGAMVYNLACLHSVMGLIDEALAGLETTLKLGCNELKVLWMQNTDPDLALVRKDPRFDALFSKFGY